MLHRFTTFALLTLSLSFASGATVSYTGTFTADDDVQLFTFQLAAPGTVTAQTLSFGGGVNAAGTAIAPGGFSPDIWLFDSSGILLQADSPESPDHSAPLDCGPRAIDPATGFCWDGYINAPLAAGSYTLALTQDGNVLADGFSLAGGFTEQGVPNYTDVLGLGGEFYLPDGVTERDGNWALDLTGVSTPEPTSFAAVALGLVLFLARRSFLTALGRSKNS